jgi:leucine-zipper-like transcriptional regulator 1
VLPSSTSRPPPSPRDRHASVAYGNAFYVHGGFDGASRDASLFAFDFSILEWREVIAAQGRPPTARHSHAAVVHGHSIYIFGGYDGSYKSDLHEFDLTLSRWNLVSVAGRRPRARYRTTCTVYNNWMILYGGHGRSSCSIDILICSRIALLISLTSSIPLFLKMARVICPTPFFLTLTL